MKEDQTYIDPNAVCWYAMAPTYGREQKAKEYLDSRNVKSYLPTKEVVNSRTKKIMQVPLVSGLLFVYTSQRYLTEICTEIPFLYYRYVKHGQRSYKMTIPTTQMDSFLKVTSLRSKDTIYFDPVSAGVDLSAGTPIKIHSTNSVIDGVEGVYIKIKGRRNKCLVISLSGLVTTATMVDVSLIEIINRA